MCEGELHLFIGEVLQSHTVDAYTGEVLVDVVGDTTVVEGHIALLKLESHADFKRRHVLVAVHDVAGHTVTSRDCFDHHPTLATAVDFGDNCVIKIPIYLFHVYPLEWVEKLIERFFEKN